MKIFKENSYDIIRLYINQLGIMIFSMLLYTAVGSFENKALADGLSIFVSVFSVVFYLVLIYYMMWEIGAKDKIRIDAGRMLSCNHKGAVMGIFANAPNLFLGILTLIFLVIYLAGSSDAVYSVFLIFNMIMRFHASMYLGIITAIVPGTTSTGTPDFTEYLIETVLFIIIPMISVAVTHLAYYLGNHDKKIFSATNK